MTPTIYKFKQKVFKTPYTPYYDHYKGHKFVIKEMHEGDHVYLECISDSNVKVNGYVHLDEIERIGENK